MQIQQEETPSQDSLYERLLGLVFVFIQLGSMRKTFHEYPKILLMDSTYKITASLMPLNLCMVIDRYLLNLLTYPNNNLLFISFLITAFDHHVFLGQVVGRSKHTHSVIYISAVVQMILVPVARKQAENIPMAWRYLPVLRSRRGGK